MAYEVSSAFFRKLPEELLAPEGEFAEDVRVLLEHRARLSELEDALYEVTVQAEFPGDDVLASFVRGPSWDAEALRRVLRAASVFAIAVNRHLDTDSPAEWIADLVGMGLVGQESAATVQQVIDELIAADERHFARARADFGVLPSYDSLQYTTEVRGAMVNGRRLRTRGSCSVALRLDTGEPQTLFFQVNRQQLHDLIDALSRAAKDLDALERSIAPA